MLLGLTGGISSGKSTVANFFELKGIPIIDADVIAREIVEPGSAAWKEIINFFGNEILLPSGQLDRKKLGDIIFHNPEKRNKLDEITHQKIIDEAMLRADNFLKENEHVLIDIPLLFETKSEGFFDLILLVYVDKEIQIERLMLRDNINQKEALYKINAQMDIKKKIKKADIVIYNNENFKETKKQVEIIIQDINKGRYK